jgi:hypothetical protein
MPSTRDYSMRLREEAQRELAPSIDRLKENIRLFQQSLAESFSQFEERTRDIGALELAAAESIVAEAVDQTARQRDEEMASLATFIVQIQQKETQEEILGLFLDEAHRYAPRLVLFITRESNLTGWSSRGFSEDAAVRISSCSLAQAESSALKNALDCGSRLSVNDVTAETALLSLFEEEARSPWHVFPMRAMQRPVAVLLASDAEEKKCGVDTLLAITAITQLCIENIALKILREIETQYIEEETVPATPVPEMLQAEEVKPAEPVPEPIAEQAEPEVSAEPTPVQAEIAESDVSSASAEVVSQPEPIQSGAPDLSASTQEEVVSAAVETETLAPESPEIQIVSAESESAPGSVADAIVQALAEPVSEAASTLPADTEKAPQLSEEEKNHADAKRFARLLVSEIKLYNERRVLDGRRNRDIYVRLKKDIDRSREMYVQRVSPSVARKVDYFHDEILRILGDNDPSTLGSDYPGPDIAS